MRPWEKNIRQVVPYVPGEQPAGDKIVKLNTNENPYPPAPGVKKVLEEMEADRLRKYPVQMMYLPCHFLLSSTQINRCFSRM